MASRSKRGLVVRNTSSPALQETLQWLKDLGFVKEDVLAMSGLSKDAEASAVARLADNPRFRELAEIIDLARQLWGKKAKHWFFSAEPRLGNVQPATLLRDPENGPNLVKQVLYNSLKGPIC